MSRLSTPVNTAQRCRPVTTCTHRGCSEPSNGIKPFDKCPRHFRAYQEFTGKRQQFVDVLQAAVRADAFDLSLFDGDELGDHAPDVEELIRDQELDDEFVGALMDQIIGACDSRARLSRLNAPRN